MSDDIGIVEEVVPMEKYIGVKVVHAAPMTLGEYNKLRGWTIPEDENPEIDGFLVLYPDGYRSWCPKPQFEQANRLVNKMTFGHAIEAMKIGAKVAREEWGEKNAFVFLVPGSEFKVNRAPLLGIYPEGTEIKYHSHIDMKTTQGYIVPWLASQADMLAEDWSIVE